MKCPRCGHPEYSEETGCPACSQQTPAPATGSTGAITSATWEDALTRLEPLPEGAETRPPTAPPTTGLLRAGQQFGGRYQILKVLGKGGMGVVYRAWDEELGVAVALKVIRPEMVSDPKTGAEIERRFKRELVLARQVTHKNVVRIHDLGEMDGIKYLTMPFIQGQDLSGVISASGKLPVDRALLIGRQIAAGLAAAHDVGVIHRDLKPANVMLDNEDHAVILDFGIARSTSGPTMASAAMVGTLHYMAPEQADGRAVDQRADIYAFGLVLYDMLVGKRRTAGTESGIADLMSRIKGPPRSVRELEPGVPEGLAELISRCLAPDPIHRFQTTAELVAALDRLDNAGNTRPVTASAPAKRSRLGPMIAAVALLLSAVAIWLALRPSAPGVVVQREPISVLVADFQNGTGDPVFNGTLEHALALGIEGASFISAYPRRDAERAAQQIAPGSPIDENTGRLVCQREGIKTMLVGSIVAAGGGYTVSVRVIDPIPGKELASASESASDKSSVLNAVGELSARIRTALGDATPQSAMAAATETFTTTSLEAARDYAEAQALANSNRDEEAIAVYQHALKNDPKLGRAYSGWAASAFKLGRKDEAEEQYKKAFELVERMTEREKLRTRSTYYLNISGNYDLAFETNKELADKYPADGAAHNNLALAYFNRLEFDQALEQGKHLLDIYPGSGLYRYNYALYAMYAGDFATAATEAQAALKINPNLHKAHLAIAMAALADGKTDEARTAYEAARGAGPRGVSLAGIGLADLAMYQGRFEDALPLLEKGIAEDEQGKNTAGAAAKAIALAEAQRARGNAAGASEALARARKLSDDPSVLVPAARLLLQLNREADITGIVTQLDSALVPRTRAYARVVRAILLLERSPTQPQQALDALQAAQKDLADLWLVRFLKGVAYVEAGAYAEALSELELCEKRRGEATAIFLDDVPSYRYMVPLSYWLGRVHEGLGARAAAQRHFKAYLALRSPATDALARDAARR